MRYYFIIIASIIIGATQAQKIDLGRSVLINDDTEKSLTFINAQKEEYKIVSEILFSAGFQFFLDKSDSLIIVYGLSIPYPFVGEKYELEANLEFYKYDDNSCIEIKSYKTRFFVGSDNKLQSKVTSDGFLQIIHNGQHLFDIKLKTLSEEGFNVIHHFYQD
jgi:hypothetical protein